MQSFDNVIDAISTSVNYTVFLTGICYFFEILLASIVVAPVFVAGFPSSRCKVEPFDNKTAFPNLTNKMITETFIPWNSISQDYDRCSRKLLHCNNFEDCLTKNNTKVTDCNGSYLYDRSKYEDTIVTEWDLVCQEHTWVTLSASLGFLGAFLGSVCGGVLADRYGRVLVVKCSTLLLLAQGCGLAFSPNMWIFTLLHFLEVLTAFAGGMAAFSYILEIVPSRQRTAFALLFHSFFGAGCMLLSVYAVLWKNWRQQHLIRTLTLGIPVFLTTFLLPKSPRWLFSSGEISEAKKVCKLIAKRNKAKLQENTWKAAAKENETDLSEPIEKLNTLKESFRRPYTRFLMLANMCVWCFNCLVYYGLTMNSGALAGDPYVNNALTGLMELVSCILGIFVISRFGFVKSNVYSLSLSGSACLLSTLLIQVGHGNDVVERIGTILAMVGIFGSSMTFAFIYLQTTELFPTCGRCTALGLASMSARIGSIITPWTIELQFTVPWLTQAIFGVVCFIGALIAACFPETKDHNLTMTYEEAEEFFQRSMQDSTASKLFCLPKRDFDGTQQAEKALMDKEETTAQN